MFANDLIGNDLSIDLIDGQARAGAPLIDRQLWTNHIYMDQVERTLPDRRPLALSRAADLGSQRHPIHFTGDTWSPWEVLPSSG